MGSADPFGSEKTTIVDSLKWLKYKIDRGQASRAAKKGNYSPRGENPEFMDHGSVQKSTSPGGKHSMLRTNTLLQILIAGIVAAIPITFYLVQSDDKQEKASISMAEEVIGRGSPKNTQRQNRINNSNAQQSTERMGALGTGAPSETIAEVMDDTAMEHAAKHAQQNYVCPMHPEIISNDVNATCPICGMDLVPLESGGEAGIVKLTPTVMNSLGVRTAKAKRRTLYRRIDSVGYINVDENNMRTISLRSEGWVERLVVKTSGERVTKGQLLMELYAPVLVNAQEEYLQAMRHNNELLIKASRDRLIALGVAEEQIAILEETKVVESLVKVYAPQSGIVSELNVREGMFVKPSQNLLNLVDLSSVWLMVDIFERQADWVQTGQRAEATLPFMPGKSWEGKVEYVYPSLDASTRSLKVRLRFDNFEEDLKPNMYADVTIYAKPKREALTIPREALIRTGNEKRVVVALGEGKFIPMPISTGMETDDRVEVLSGLAEGDEVVTSSQFLIDSESSLKAALARMAGG